MLFFMYANICCASVQGVEALWIDVETDISPGLPQVNVVGLPDPAVRESVERVRAAVKNCGFQFPLQRITVNLAPADQRKEGTAFDLAIAAGILIVSGQLDGGPLSGTLVIGELALSGEVRPVPGVLPMVEQAKRRGIRRVLLPAGNAAEAALIGGMDLFAVTHLSQLAGKDWDALRFVPELSGIGPMREEGGDDPLGAELDFADVIGQPTAKRAVLTAAAGRHNLLLSGPPGTGKTMLVKRLPGILPPLTEEEALNVTKIYSAAGKLGTGKVSLIRTRPFRSPHHTISSGGLIGGGSVPKPGEVTLAFSPYTDNLTQWIDQARAAGHEVLLDLPMEPINFPANDPGPRTLLTSLTPQQNLERLEWVLNRATGYVGVTNEMGSRFTAVPEALEPVLTTLNERGLMFLDSRTTTRSVAAKLASEIGLPRAIVDRWIDHEVSRDAIDARLAEIERIARETGSAVAMAQPYPISLERIASWIPSLESKGFVLSPLTAVVNRQPVR